MVVHRQWSHNCRVSSLIDRDIVREMQISKRLSEVDLCLCDYMNLALL